MWISVVRQCPSMFHFDRVHIGCQMCEVREFLMYCVSCAYHKTLDLVHEVLW
jgi:hypothetical protein